MITALPNVLVRLPIARAFAMHDRSIERCSLELGVVRHSLMLPCVSLLARAVRSLLSPVGLAGRLIWQRARNVTPLVGEPPFVAWKVWKCILGCTRSAVPLRWSRYYPYLGGATMN